MPLRSRIRILPGTPSPARSTIRTLPASVSGQWPSGEFNTTEFNAGEFNVPLGLPTSGRGLRSRIRILPGTPSPSRSTIRGL